ncbi:MAG: hypothetical protein KDE47_25685, partial [Caldilineaceae bacterium]|nr:hypothetical protein [Caldilineaceae bacterium]
LDTNGVFQWSERVGGIGDDAAFDLALGTTSTVYVTGRFQGTVNFDASTGIPSLVSAGENDAFIIEFATE